ncbi:hypothetical protein GDO86_016951 [Hymenochirus boettgeri]|uniref:Ig-like domain-containing protein n=1 Tax=Hymenochirus boettgeri TaxID=247094 RepID=A0A8T2IN64_9PIPI|nr:hypothetical protein GDO86_016951 [Hymenochirus boettgeri]
MSNENDSSGEFSTTTVSSVAIQAGDSRIVVAVLKCGALVELQLAEAIPSLLEIGSNQDETKKLLEDHEMLLGKLKSLEDHVWDLLCEADKTAGENPEQGQVYDAMAVTLKEAWDAIISALENRRSLLHVASEFFKIAQEFTEALNQVEVFLHSSPYQDTEDSIIELLHQHKIHTKVLLERSLALLNKSQELTKSIDLFKLQKPISNSDMIREARNSCRRIDNLLELLQDRRRQLDKYLKQKKNSLEQVLQVIQWHQREDKVSCWLQKHIDLYLTEVQLGASLTENEELIYKHNQIVLDAKPWTSVIDKLKSEASRLVALEGCEGNESLKDSDEKLNRLHAEFRERMDQRQDILQEANAFFQSVNKAFDKLGSIESYVKHLTKQNLHFPALSAKKGEAEIRTWTCDAFQKGQILLSKFPNSPGMSGIQEMVGYLQKRVDQLTVHIPTSNEQMLKAQQNARPLEEHLKEVSLWIQRISTDLESYNDPGWNLTECEEVLSRLTDLANQTKLKSAIQSLRKLYTSSPEEGSELEMTSVLESAEAQLQFVLTELFSVQDMGQNCLNSIKMMDKNTVLNKKHAQAIEKTIDNLNKEKAEITNLCSVWQQRIKQANSTKQHWRTIKDQLRSATNGLHILEKELQPFHSLNLGSDYRRILNAQEKLNHIKIQYQSLSAEADYAVKISDLLTREGTQMSEQSEKIDDLAQLHQRVRDSIIEYEDIFIKVVAFYQVKTELEFLNKSQLTLEEKSSKDEQVTKMQEQQSQLQNLYKLVLNLGREIISTIQHSKYITIPIMEFQEQMDKMEQDNVYPNSSGVKQDEELLSHLYFDTTMDDINELKESFKDLKKKFNNLKFNYTKKSEKGRNLKVIKNQLLQVETYTEKMQVLKKKIELLEKKVSITTQAQNIDKAHVLLEAVGELQKQVNDFSTVMDEYKQNLVMAEDLQHIMEECQFWCEEACATVVRVGRYSAECKTKESVETLLKQFNKFIQPTVPQQLERIEQMSRIAKHVCGPDEGAKYVDKMTVKHKEAMQSVNELCLYLKELHEKLEEPQKVAPEEPILSPAGELSTLAKEANIVTETELHPELLAEEAASGDEYECISPDDISLPPLAETPESNLPQSETEQEEQHCVSSHSLHVTSYNLQMQLNANGKKMVDRSELLTPVSNTDVSSCKKEKTSSCIERFCSPSVGYKVDSPFAHQPAIVHERVYSLNSPSAKASPSHSMMNELHETLWQHHSVYESMKKTQQLHVSNNSTKTKDRMHATPDDFSSVTFQPDPDKSSQGHVTSQEVVKSNVRLSGQKPGISKHLPNVTVKEGSPVTLEVEVTGYPEPTLTWWVAYNEEH